MNHELAFFIGAKLSKNTEINHDRFVVKHDNRFGFMSPAFLYFAESITNLQLDLKV